MKKMFNLMLIFCTLSLFAFAHAEDSDEKSDSPEARNVGEKDEVDCIAITDQSGKSGTQIGESEESGPGKGLER